jgi:hypothetical protein
LEEGKGIPQGLKPRFVDDLKRTKAKALGYLEAMASAEATVNCEASAEATATATTEADPYGMTNKRTSNDNYKSKCNYNYRDSSLRSE